MLSLARHGRMPTFVVLSGIAMNENAQCLTCGKPIYIRKGLRGRKKYCSRACLAEARKRRVLLICECCGVTFFAHASRPDKKYCSRDCRARASTSLTAEGLRRCTGCGDLLPATLEHFGARSNTKLGLTSECRKCLSIRGKELKKRRQKIDKDLRANYRKANPEKVKQWKRKSYLRNREEVVKKSQAYRLANPDNAKLTTEQQRVKTALRRGRKLNAAGKYTKDDITNQYRIQGGRCFYCSCDLTEYHVDHYIPLSRGGTNWPSNIVLACPQCNMAKGDMMPERFIDDYLPISLRLRRR